MNLYAGSFPNFDNAGGGAWSNGYSRPISVTNSTGSPLTDYQVLVQPFPPTYEETNPLVTFTGTGWINWTNDVRYSGWSTKYSNTNGDYCQFTFNGTGVIWIAAKCDNRGIAKVYIDGAFDANIDLYASPNLYQQLVYTKTGLTNGQHTIKIEVTNTKNASSSGYYVDIDAFFTADNQSWLINNNLVGSWHFSEGSGTGASDMSGNGNNGTLTNGPTWLDGRFGKGLSFDGTNDYVSVADSDSLDMSLNDFSIEAWINIDSDATAGGGIVVKLGDYGYQFGTHDFYNDDRLWLWLRIRDTSGL